MAWNVEYTDEFGTWWIGLTDAEQEDIDATVQRLEARGPNLPFPYSSGIKTSRHDHMRELRVQPLGTRSGCSTPLIRPAPPSC